MSDDCRAAAAPDGAEAAPPHTEQAETTGTPLGQHPTDRAESRDARARPRRGRSLVTLDASASGSHALRWMLVALVVLVVLAVGGWAFDRLAYADKVHPGVRVAGVDIGGLTPAEAGKRLAKQLAPRYQRPITATFKGMTWTVVSSSLGAALDATATIDEALAHGRTGDLIGDSAWRLKAYFEPVDLTPASTVDSSAVDVQLDRLAKGVRTSSMDAAVVVDGTSVSVRPPRPGRELDRQATQTGLVAALPKLGGRTVVLHVPLHEAGISEASAERAASQARTMIAADAIVEHEGKRWTMTPSDIAKSIGFVVLPAGKQNDATSLVPTAGADPPAASAGATGAVELGARIDPTKLGTVLGPRIGGLGVPARDARFVASGTKVTIIPSQAGQGPDTRSLARGLSASLRSTDAAKRAATLRLRRIEPKLTTAEAKSYGIVERISTFTTVFSANNKPRVNNIRMLAKAIDGSVVAPGDTWSVNGHVGERTAAKGYQDANAIVGNALVPQLGGGICQVVTTLFNALFFSGEPIVQRTNHSIYTSHYPTGRDATVAWGGPDLKFRNDTHSWILIKTVTGPNSVTVNLYGTSPGYRVALTTSPLKKTGDFTTSVTKDPKLPAGMKVVKNPGIPGYSVTVIRTVTRNGKVVRTDTFASNYKPMAELVVVGTGPAAASKRGRAGASSSHN